MKLLLKLAWRNIWRNKRRSILTLLAIIFATLSAIAMRGIQLGTYEESIKHAVEQFSGYIQIQPKSYKKNPSLNKTVKIDPQIRSYLDNSQLVKGYAERIIADGLISYKDNSFGAAIFGIVPDQESKTTRIIKRINKGEFFESDTSSEIVVGYKLLQNLNAEIGDEVVVLAQGYDGTMGNLKYKVVGTVKLGSYEFDAMAVFMGLKTSQELLMMYGKSSIAAISVNSLNAIPKVKSDLKNYIDQENEVVLAWQEVMPELEQFISLDNISGIFFLFILVIIVAFGILNTLLMSVTERFNEFGVTLAIGMKQSKLVILILLETIFLSFVGVIIGDLIGFGINTYLTANPIMFEGELKSLYEEYGFLPIIKSSIKASIFITTSIGVVLISLFASIYPIIKTYKLEPLKGIRYT